MSAVPLPLLDRVRTASPCPVRWEDMRGDDRTRRCDQCNLSVHNLSAMTGAEAEAFLAEKFGADRSPQERRVCAIYYRRADGTILTADCPVGVAALRARARRAAVRVAAALGLVTLTGISAAGSQEGSGLAWRWAQPFSALARLAGLQTAPPAPPLAGAIAITPLPLPPPPSPAGGSR